MYGLGRYIWVACVLAACTSGVRGSRRSIDVRNPRNARSRSREIEAAASTGKPPPHFTAPGLSESATPSDRALPSSGVTTRPLTTGFTVRVLDVKSLPDDVVAAWAD